MHQDLTRLYTTIHSRGDLEVEVLDFDHPSPTEGHVRGTLRFYDGSRLVFEEKTLMRARHIEKITYRYHYQHTDGTMVFRYDNAPHYPDLPNFPYHKHVGDRVEPAEAPDLHDVLAEVDGILYSPEGES